MKITKYALAFAALLFTALGSTPARADTIVQSGGIVTAINGITIAGVTYNVTFGTTDDTTFAGSATALTAITAISTDLSPFQSVNNPTTTLVGVDAGSNNVFLAGSLNLSGQFAQLGGQTNTNFQSFLTFPGTAAYAEFAPTTAAPVPEPSSMLLLGTGLLGLAGAMRRKRLA